MRGRARVQPKNMGRGNIYPPLLHTYSCRRATCNTRLATIIPTTAASPLFPLPTFATWTFSMFTLIYQNAPLLVEQFISRNTPTPTRISSISINPFTSTITLGGVHVCDPENRPLVSVPKLKTKLIFKNGFSRPPACQITAPSMNVTAVLLSDLKRTNWSQLADIYQTADDTSTKSDSKNEDLELKSPEFYEYDLSVKAPKITLLVEPNTRLLPTIRLPPLHISSKQVGNAAAVAHLADDLVARVVKENDIKSFPSKFRKVAQSWTQKATSDRFNKAVNWGQKNLESLRFHIQSVDDAAQDLPGLHSVQAWTKRARDALDMIQRASGSKSSPSDSDLPDSNRRQTQRRTNGQFRELDEQDQ